MSIWIRQRDFVITYALLPFGKYALVSGYPWSLRMKHNTYLKIFVNLNKVINCIFILSSFKHCNFVLYIIYIIPNITIMVFTLQICTGCKYPLYSHHIGNLWTRRSWVAWVGVATISCMILRSVWLSRYNVYGLYVVHLFYKLRYTQVTRVCEWSVGLNHVIYVIYVI